MNNDMCKTAKERLFRRQQKGDHVREQGDRAKAARNCVQEPCAKALRERKLPECDRVRELCARVLRERKLPECDRMREPCAISSAERAKAARMRPRERTVCDNA